MRYLVKLLKNVRKLKRLNVKRQSRNILTSSDEVTTLKKVIIMKYIVTFLLGFIFWLLLMWNLSFQSILIGIIVSLLITILFKDFHINEYNKLFNPFRWFWLIIYLLIFFWQCIKANIDVAYRVIHPDMPINPGIVKVKTNLKSNIGKTILANSITLTPGTLTIEINDDILYIHWINVLSDDVEKATEEIVKKFEKYLIRIFE